MSLLRFYKHIVGSLQLQTYEQKTRQKQPAVTRAILWIFPHNSIKRLTTSQSLSSEFHSRNSESHLHSKPPGFVLIKFDVWIQKCVPCDWHIQKKIYPQDSGNKKYNSCYPCNRFSNQRNFQNAYRYRFLLQRTWWCASSRFNTQHVLWIGEGISSSKNNTNNLTFIFSLHQFKDLCNCSTKQLNSLLGNAFCSIHLLQCLDAIKFSCNQLNWNIFALRNILMKFNELLNITHKRHEAGHKFPLSILWELKLQTSTIRRGDDQISI